ncbi:SpoIIE family protein phosphatase [Micromonospora auratinigra]|uniref:Serine phosphatase RsbU, regulator of sigma subunit n=1 Tax=Micromonospora auratinigra TaxID=261654 RepID=A0A1A9A898_9ACTN|nr:SpoIIE family protein phosphatase [Micromonospora auratinigra]SBT52333.1 Serine phosphatase RsbU, regulator of sigma subunit [Micromonospora auratinigra]
MPGRTEQVARDGADDLLPADVLRQAHAEVVVLVLLDEAGDHLDLVWQAGMVPEVAETWSRFPLGAPVAIARSARTGEPLEAGSFRERLIRFPATASVPTADVEGLVTAPVWHPEAGSERTVIGAMSMGFRGTPPAGATQTLIRLAGYAAERVRAAGLPYGSRRPVPDDPAPLPTTSALAHLVRGAGAQGIDQALLETVLLHLPVGVSVLDRELRFTLVNQRAAAINGRTPDEHLGRHLREVLPDLPESFDVELRGVLRTGRPLLNHDIVGRTPGRAGERRWRGSYYPVVGASPTGPIGLAAVFDEVADEETLGVEQLAAERADTLTVLDTLVENAPVGVALLDTGLRYLKINRTLADWNGRSVADHLGRRLPDLLPELAPLVEPVMREVAETGVVRDVETVTAGRTWLSSFFGVPGPGGRTAAVALFVTEVTRRRREERRARHVQAFTEALSQAVSVAEVALAVGTAGARAAEANVASVALLDELGRQLRFAPTGQESPERWRVLTVDADHPIAVAYRSDEPAYYPELAAMLREYPQLTEAQARTGHAAWAMMPMRGRGTAAGMLTFAYRDGQAFDDEQRSLLATLAGLAGQALARAQLYEREHRTALRLQRSLLPSRLPAIPGVDLAAVYVAGDAAEVGGDFYDVFAVAGSAGREWTVVIGDVAGRGVDAASVTGLARHTLRITAATDEPADALRRLHTRLWEDTDIDRFLTVVCGRLRLHDEGAELLLASGGHPPALVRRADASVDVVTVPGMLVGAFPEVRLEQRAVPLAPGDTVLLYTDGVLEARGPAGLFGQDRLVELLRTAPDTAPERLVAHVRAGVEAYQHGPASDDIAIVALRVGRAAED